MRNPAASDSEPTSDRDLVSYVRGGDEAAAEELYRRYAVRLRALVDDCRSAAYASRFDSEDVVQSVFRVFYEGVKTRHYDAPEGEELWGLLSVLAANKLRDQIARHRAAKRSVFRTVGIDRLWGAGAHPREDQTDALLRLVVAEYLDGLSAPDRDVVALRMTGHSVCEIADRTGRARRTVERVLQKARDRLADVFGP